MQGKPSDDLLTRPATRRSVIGRAAALGLGAPLAGVGGRRALAQATPAGRSSPELDRSAQLEIFSWWTAPSEATALQTLFDLYGERYPNVEIINAAIAGGGGGAAEAVLQTRLQGQNPPDSWQTHVDYELFDQYVAAGYCEPVTELYRAEGWGEVIPAALVERLSRDGEQWSVPVGVHRGNGFWYNRQVLQDAGVTVGETMTIDDFFTAAEALDEAGVPALAFGSKDAFQPAQTFENTLLGVVGPESYAALFAGELGWDEPGVIEAMEVFARMLDYVNEDYPALTWDGATSLVIEGRAGFLSMGDWAYGEVIAKEATAAVGWVSHPGTSGSFVLVVDSFTLPVGVANPENARAWLRLIGSREAQEAFNPIKGSIPARIDIDPALFSDYHQWALASFGQDALVPSCAHGQAAPPEFEQAFYDATTAFVDDEDVDTFVGMLAEAATLLS